MNELNKILSFIIEKGCDIMQIEAFSSLRVNLKKGKASMYIIIDKIDFDYFKKEYEKVWASVPDMIKV
jgi:hypothetical protein